MKKILFLASLLLCIYVVGQQKAVIKNGKVEVIKPPVDKTVVEMPDTVIMDGITKAELEKVVKTRLKRYESLVEVEDRFADKVPFEIVKVGVRGLLLVTEKHHKYKLVYLDVETKTVKKEHFTKLKSCEKHEVLTVLFWLLIMYFVSSVVAKAMGTRKAENLRRDFVPSLIILGFTLVSFFLCSVYFDMEMFIISFVTATSLVLIVRPIFMGVTMFAFALIVIALFANLLLYITSGTFIAHLIVTSFILTFVSAIVPFEDLE